MYFKSVLLVGQYPMNTIIERITVYGWCTWPKFKGLERALRASSQSSTTFIFSSLWEFSQSSNSRLKFLKFKVFWCRNAAHSQAALYWNQLIPTPSLPNWVRDDWMKHPSSQDDPKHLSIWQKEVLSETSFAFIRPLCKNKFTRFFFRLADQGKQFAFS